MHEQISFNEHEEIMYCDEVRFFVEDTIVDRDFFSYSGRNVVYYFLFSLAHSFVKDGCVVESVCILLGIRIPPITS